VPQFKLDSTSGEINIDTYEGNPTIIVFYPQDNSKVCSNQLAVYNEALPIFRRYNANILAISTDDMTSHEKFAKQLNLRFPLLSDPEGVIGQKFGVFDTKSGRHRRAIFVLDNEQDIAFSQIYPNHINPGANEILQTLRELQQE